MGTRPRAGRCPCCAPSWPNAAGPRRSAPFAARCTDWAGAGSAPSMCWDGLTRPTRRKKAVAQQAAAMVAAGGEVWFGDETTLREFPPLRASWARRGEQQVVVVSGRNSRRVMHGALNAATGDLVALVRERSRQDDCAAFIEALGRVRPEVPKLLVWDNAPPH